MSFESNSNASNIPGFIIKKNEYIFDYYIFCNKKTEFIYSVFENIEAFILSKEFLQNKIFTKYP